MVYLSCSIISKKEIIKTIENAIVVMCTITLLATVHKERGNCNSDELYKIIEQIDPDIIFDELHPVSFAAIYEGTRADTLETKTTKLYLQKHSIAHYPVDLYVNEFFDNHFKMEIDELFDIYNYSQVYNYLSFQLDRLAEQHGYPYLNSKFRFV